MKTNKELIRLRRHLGLTQTQMALKFDTNQAAWSAWETGKRPLPVRIALRLHDRYRCNLRKLLEPNR